MFWLCKLGFHRVRDIRRIETWVENEGRSVSTIDWDFVCTNCGMKVKEHIPAVLEAEKIINRRA